MFSEEVNRIALILVAAGMLVLIVSHAIKTLVNVYDRIKYGKEHQLEKQIAEHNRIAAGILAMLVEAIRKLNEWHLLKLEKGDLDEEGETK